MTRQNREKGTVALACGLLVLILLAGCSGKPGKASVPGVLDVVPQASDTQTVQPPVVTSVSQSTTTSAASTTAAPGSQPSKEPPPSALEPESEEPVEVWQEGEPEPPAGRYAPGWPPLDEAYVRPGGSIRFLLPVEQEDEVPEEDVCSMGFVFESLDNRTLYVAAAAHCLTPPAPDLVSDDLRPSLPPPPPACVDPSLPLGYEVRVQGAGRPARLVYSSWETMLRVREKDADACAGNDFALLELHAEDRASVHPATIYKGGPRALANSSHIEVGQRVTSVAVAAYHSGYSDLFTVHEGYAKGVTDGGWTTTAYFVVPPDGVEDGSPLVNATGEAIGIQSSSLLLTSGGVAGFTNLDRALAYAAEHADIHVQLATWKPVDPGRLPNLP